ncbi:hypothetical protein TNCT_210821 [Trichonephila clavata]|uniref:Uncharacterized protein n=1 Tax=Trichonephila clavata TaxID=2740835 RepID=A0A8X6I498_TRICU|nr:hypothetical protein TNCT_210821 [Trichonephila clavata]
MAVNFLLEVSMFLLTCGLVMFVQSDQSFLQIIICTSFIEIVKYYYSRNVAKCTQLQNGNKNMDQNKLNVEKQNIPMVYSLDIYKICEGLGINAQFVQVQDKKVWKSNWKNLSNNNCGKFKPTKRIPKVRSFNVHKMCEALGLETEFDPTIEPLFVVHKRKSREFIPVVQSESIFKMCQALGIKATLAPPTEI